MKQIIFIIFILCLFLVACNPIIDEPQGTMTGSSANQSADVNLSKMNFNLSKITWCEYNNKSIAGRVYYSRCYNQTNIQPINQTNCTFNITITNQILNITLNQNISSNYSLKLNFTPSINSTSQINFTTTTKYTINNISVNSTCANVYLDLYNSKERWYLNTTTNNKTWVIPFNNINLTFT